jgi:hypothetical protein
VCERGFEGHPDTEGVVGGADVDAGEDAGGGGGPEIVAGVVNAAVDGKGLGIADC